MPEGRGARRPGHGRPGRGPGRAARADRHVRPRQRLHRADLPRPARRRRAERPAGRAGPRGRGGRGRHRQRALRHARPGPAGRDAGRDPGPAQPDRDGRLAARGRRRLSPVRGGDGPPAAPVPRCPAADRGAGPGLRVRLRGPGPEAARLPGARRVRRDVLAARAGRGTGAEALRATGSGVAARGVPPDRARAGRDRRARVPRLLPARPRHRPVLREPAHPVPGSRFGRELGRLLRAGDHQRGRGPARSAVRALPVGRAGRAARHRPGHRAPPPGRGDPVRLRPLRPGPGGPGGQRDHVPAAAGAAGRGPGARPPAGGTERLVPPGRAGRGGRRRRGRAR